ncbi:hypothetical protein HDU77_011785 [Chytriomyces hyalinus]|nr:hypothetical protein HDU77_011785 [Chytriomyces hyalinus]
MSKKVGKMEAYSCASLLPLLKGLSVEEVSLVAATVLVAPSKIEIPVVVNATLQSCAHNRASNAWERLSDATNPDIAHISDMSLLTYNILNDPSHPSNYDADTRFQSLLRILEQEGPDLIALQEVNSTFLNLALEDTSIQSHYFISAVTMDQVPTNLLLLSKYPFSYQIVQLSTGKKAIVASFGELQVAVVHLTSDYAGDKSRLRCNQFRTLVEFLGGGDAIVMGDFNMESKSALEAAFVEAGFQDGWTCTQPAGADGVTYHSVRNSLAAQVSRRGVVLRMDRVLVRLRDWDVGKSWIVGRGLEEDVSDHYGVAYVLNRACENASAVDGRVEKDCAAALSALQDIFAKAFYPSPFYMTPVGSFTLGTDSPTSDLDILCLGLIHRRDLFSILRGTDTEEREPFPFPENCRLIRILADAKIPILELSILGIHVDVQYASFPISAAHPRTAFNLDAAIAETVFPAQTHAILASYTDAQLIQLAVPDAYKSAFRLASCVLNVWARVRGMDLVTLGFPPLHALVVLLAGLFKRGDVSGTVTAGGLVAKFFRVWSAHD